MDSKRQHRAVPSRRELLPVHCPRCGPQDLIGFERDWRHVPDPARRSEEYVEGCSPFELVILNVVKSGEKAKSISGNPEEDR